MCFDDEQNAIAQRYYKAALKLEHGERGPGRVRGHVARDVRAGQDARPLPRGAIARRGRRGERAGVRDAEPAARVLVRPARGGRGGAGRSGSGVRGADLRGTPGPGARRASAHAADSRAGSAIGRYHAASHAYQEAAVRALLGDRPGAIRVLSESVRRRSADERRSRAITLASLAELHLDQGHLDESIAACHAFIDDYQPLRSSRARSALGRLTARLRPHAANHSARQLLVRAAAVSRPAG
jgi:hypothetical protein